MMRQSIRQNWLAGRCLARRAVPLLLLALGACATQAATQTRSARQATTDPGRAMVLNVKLWDETMPFDEFPQPGLTPPMAPGTEQDYPALARSSRRRPPRYVSP
jgi:hypothetical protein